MQQLNMFRFIVFMTCIACRKVIIGNHARECGQVTLWSDGCQVERFAPDGDARNSHIYTTCRLMA